MTNQLIYYIALYIFVFVIRFFKIFHYNLSKSANDPNKKGYIHISLEIVYSASGFVILLIQALTSSVAPILMIYAVFLISSAFLDIIEEKYLNKLTAYLNSIIIFCIVAATVIFLAFVLPKLAEDKENESKKVEVVHDTLKTYQVSVPYLDNTLRKHVGFEKFRNRRLVYFSTLKAKNDSIAIFDALLQFERNDTCSPIFPSIAGLTQPFIQIDTSEIIVKLIEKP